MLLVFVVVFFRTFYSCRFILNLLRKNSLEVVMVVITKTICKKNSLGFFLLV